jgi:hypothetical protein
MKSFEIDKGPKQQVRNLICSHAENEIGNVKRIFTLPSKEALCYHTFKLKFPQSAVSCIEREASIVRILHDKDIDCEQTTILDFAVSKTRLERHFDVVFLDYYSYLTGDILNEIRAFINNDNIIHPTKPTILAITLMKAMRSDKSETLDLLSKYRWQGYRSGTNNDVNQVAEGLLGFIEVEFDFTNVKLLESFQYQATGNSAPMYFILLKITK